MFASVTKTMFSALTMAIKLKFAMLLIAPVFILIAGFIMSMKSGLVKNNAAIENFRKLLKTGGVVIGTEPLVAPISIYDDSRWGENHRYSPRSLKELLETQFEILHFKNLGNAATSAAVVLGIPVERFNKQLLGIERPSHATCMFYIVRKNR